MLFLSNKKLVNFLLLLGWRQWNDEVFDFGLWKIIRKAYGTTDGTPYLLPEWG